MFSARVVDSEPVEEYRGEILPGMVDDQVAEAFLKDGEYTKILPGMVDGKVAETFLKGLDIDITNTLVVSRQHACPCGA